MLDTVSGLIQCEPGGGPASRSFVQPGAPPGPRPSSRHAQTRPGNAPKRATTAPSLLHEFRRDIGPAWSEPALIGLAYAFERASQALTCPFLRDTAGSGVR